MSRSYGGQFLSAANGGLKYEKTPKQIIDDRLEKEKEKTRPKNYPLPIGYKSSKSTEGSFSLRADSGNIAKTILHEQERVYRL